VAESPTEPPTGPESDTWALAERLCTERELAVLRMRHPAGMTHREIAAALDCSHSTVYDTQRRGERRLERALRSPGAPD
jgi:DNA-directed RNA polymerase specialized sigma24 family protein